jgi:hypothetical protein
MTAKKPKRATERLLAVGQCLCGAVEIEFEVPAFWAWHDHSKATQRAHGAAYATYVGCWKSKTRITKGKAFVATYEQPGEARRRSFCEVCGTPLMYERGHAPRMVNIPRALFETRTGREPRYHVGLPQSPEWAYRGEKLSPVKAYPGLLMARPRKTKPASWD